MEPTTQPASRAPVTWNWPAFFFSIAWFLYRGLPGWAVLNAIALAAFVPLLLAANESGSAALYGTVLLVYAVGLFVLIPAFANRIYYARLRKQLAGAADGAPPRAPSAGRWFGAALGGLALVFGAIVVAFYATGIGFTMYTTRSKVTEMINSAGVCRTSVAEFYQSRGKMPANATEADCSTLGTTNSDPPTVDKGIVRVRAAGPLRKELERARSGIDFQYTPICTDGVCTRGPISSWDCKTGTTVLPKFLPAACR